MARKRMIDPDFWTDEKVSELTISAKLFFIGLWNFADDEGFLSAGAKKLKALIFPYDFEVKDIEGFLKELLKQKLIANDDDLIKIVNFEKHQYIKKKLQTIKQKREKFKQVQKSLEKVVPKEVEVEVKGSEVKGNEIEVEVGEQKTRQNRLSASFNKKPDFIGHEKELKEQVSGLVGFCLKGKEIPKCP